MYLRNLKPSSLYIKPTSDGFSFLQIGDYGIPTIMIDARSKTRILPNAFDYIAPEVIDAKSKQNQSFNFESDIWTIGTVLLDICSTSVFDVFD